MNFSIKDFFSKCDQIRSFLRIWSHLLKKCLLENFAFCAVMTDTDWHNSGQCQSSLHTKKAKSSIKDFVSKCDQILISLQIWSHLLQISLKENYIFVQY